MGLTHSLEYETISAATRTFLMALTFGFIASVIVGGISPNISIGALIFSLVGAIGIFQLWRRTCRA